MGTKEIFSTQHPFVKECVRLRLDKKARMEAQMLLLMGKKMILELSPKIPFKAVITCHLEKAIQAKEHYIVSQEVLKKITGLSEPDGWAAIVSPPSPQEPQNPQRTLILDQLTDPGNLGTLLRTALALDWDHVLLTPGTVDPFNDKALRASRGALFSLPFCIKKPEDIREWVQTNQIHLYLAHMQGTPLQSIHPTYPLALLLSHEGAGLSSWTNNIGKKVSIPMFHQVESLNVAISGAILLHSLRRS